MNKPIAWTIDELNTYNWGDTDWQITVTKEKWSDKQKPLYIHPADITDEEIREVLMTNPAMAFLVAAIGISKENIEWFARAILRKVSEK